MASVRTITFTVGMALAAAGAAQAQSPEPAAVAMTPAQVAVACAPSPMLGVTPADAPRVHGSQDTETRSLFGNDGPNLVINAGTDRGVQLNQRYFVRRIYRGAETHTDKNAHLVLTSGWVRITAVNRLMSLAVAEHACSGIVEGDYLEPFYVPRVSADLFVPETTGQLDFNDHSRILYGHSERWSGSTGEFMLIDRGTDRNVAIGSHFAIYRDREVTGLPLTPIAEATAVAVGPTLSVVRITAGRDAVITGDVVIPRGPAQTPKNDVEALLPVGVTVPPAIADPNPMLQGVTAAIQELAEYRRLLADGSARDASSHLKNATSIIKRLPRPEQYVVQGVPSDASLMPVANSTRLATSTDIFELVQNAMRELTEYGSLMADNAPRAADERLMAARQTVDRLEHLKK
jgi:hypothetical protein